MPFVDQASHELSPLGSDAQGWIQATEIDAQWIIEDRLDRLVRVGNDPARDTAALIAGANAGHVVAVRGRADTAASESVLAQQLVHGLGADALELQRAHWIVQ